MAVAELEPEKIDAEPVTEVEVAKPKKKRLPPVGPLGKLFKSKDEAEKPENEIKPDPASKSDSNPYGIWKYADNFVWAKNKQEAVYYVIAANPKFVEAERVDAQRRGAQRKLDLQAVVFLMSLAKANDRAKYDAVKEKIPHLAPYFPVDMGGQGKEIPDELANDPTVAMFA